MRHPRFEIVHTGAGQWHVRIRAGNGAIVYVTESYKRRAAAVAAVDLARDAALWDVRDVDAREKP